MKKEYILLAIVTVALGLYLYFQNSDLTQYTLPTPEVITDTDITKIEIKKQDTELTLNKSGENWTIGAEGYPAQTAKVTEIIDLIKEIRLTALISESSSYARYELDDANKTSVTAWKDDTILRRFDIGKAASSYKHTFIRLDGDKKVYHAEKNMTSTLNTNQDKVLDKTVMSFKADAVYSFAVTDAGNKSEFAKKMEEIKVDITKDKEKDETEAEKPAEPKEVWFAANGDTKDKNAILTFIKKFASLKCDRYAKGKTKEALKEPLYTFSATTDKPYTIEVFKGDNEETFICTSSENAFPFELSKSTIDGFKESFGKI